MLRFPSEGSSKKSPKEYSTSGVGVALFLHFAKDEIHWNGFCEGSIFT